MDDKKSIKWTFAKTYAETAPHEYILEENYPDFFAEMKEKIDKKGKGEPFTLFGRTTIYRYFYTDTHRYWVIEDVLNRDNRYNLKKV